MNAASPSYSPCETMCFDCEIDPKKGPQNETKAGFVPRLLPRVSQTGDDVCAT